jgi:hypothetical protein
LVFAQQYPIGKALTSANWQDGHGFWEKGMSNFGRTILGWIMVLGSAGCDGALAARQPSPVACSIWLTTHVASATQSAERRNCVLTVASSYIDAEENSAAPENQLLADNVSRHRIGTPPDFQPGNRARIIAENSHAVIAAIRNRQWTIEGDEAWILYDGYLKKDPGKVGFTVAERITLERGLIKEILVADIALAK